MVYFIVLRHVIIKQLDLGIGGMNVNMLHIVVPDFEGGEAENQHGYEIVNEDTVEPASNELVSVKS